MQTTTLEQEQRKRGLLRSLYRPRNYIAFCLEAFFGSFGMTMFSFMTVLPGYIKTLTDNGIFVSLLTIICYAGNYGVMIFACTASVNRKKLKWIYLSCTFSIRIGLVGIFISSFLIAQNPDTALWVAILGFSIFNVAMGFSNPLYAALVSRTIGRGLSSFFGSYMLISAIAGVLASQVVRVVLNSFSYPMRYQVLFGIGAFTAFFAVIAMAFVLKEVPEAEVESPMKFKHLPGIMVGFVKKSRSYRGYLLVRTFTAIGEMAMPFYIVQIATLPFATPGLVGTLSMIMLLSQAVFGKIWGLVGEKHGPVTILALNCAMGAIAVALALFAKSAIGAYLLFVLVGAIVNGIGITMSVASINYSVPRMLPIMNATSGLIIAPIVMVFSLMGGLLDKYLGIHFVFFVAGAGFLIALLLSFSKRKVQYCSAEERVDA